MQSWVKASCSPRARQPGTPLKPAWERPRATPALLVFLCGLAAWRAPEHPDSAADLAAPRARSTLGQRPVQGSRAAGKPGPPRPLDRVRTDRAALLDGGSLASSSGIPLQRPAAIGRSRRRAGPSPRERVQEPLAAGREVTGLRASESSLARRSFQRGSLSGQPSRSPLL